MKLRVKQERPPVDFRAQLAQKLVGKGIEIGPGLDPVKLSHQATALYVDKPLPGGYAAAHGLASSENDPTLSIERDIDLDGMNWLSALNVNFLIGCHLIEHLVNPIRFIAESWESLPEGGYLYLVVPDRELTFDFGRSATNFDHLWNEYIEQVVVLDEAHVRGDLQHSMGLLTPEQVPDHEVVKWTELTVHAHCWNSAEFMGLLYLLAQKGVASWRLVDSYWPENIGINGFEYGVLLRKIRHSSNSAVLLLKDYVVDVLNTHPGERAKWQDFTKYISGSENNFGFAKTVNPNAILPLVYFAVNEGVDFQMNDLEPLALIASKTSNSPFGLGRVAAYWRKFLR